MISRTQGREIPMRVCFVSKRKELEAVDGWMEEGKALWNGVSHSPLFLSIQLVGAKLWWDLGMEEDGGNCQINTPSRETSQGWAQNLWNGTHLPSATGNGVGSWVYCGISEQWGCSWWILFIYLFIHSWKRVGIKSSATPHPPKKPHSLPQRKCLI